MAEDGGSDVQVGSEGIDERYGGAGPTGSRRRTQQSNERKRKPCNSRIDELAKPNKRLLLALWENHAHLLEPQRAELIKQILVEEYSMTPEETQKYFEQMRKDSKALAKRKRMRKQMRKDHKDKLKRFEEERVWKIFERRLKKAFVFAYYNEIPAFVSPRLRTLSNAVLEQICELQELIIPDPSLRDHTSQFLIRISDWIAIMAEIIYFEVQIGKNLELEQIEKEDRTRREEAKVKADKVVGEPLAASTPIGSGSSVAVTATDPETEPWPFDSENGETD